MRTPGIVSSGWWVAAAAGRHERPLAVVLDGTVYTAPVIQNKLGADNRITGVFTTQEADELAKILRAGALPATLRYLQELTVGASLGRDSIRDGIRARGSVQDAKGPAQSATMTICW